MASLFFARHKSAPSLLLANKAEQASPKETPSSSSSCELLLRRLKQQKQEIPPGFMVKRKSAPTTSARAQANRAALPGKVSTYLAKPSVGRPSAKKQRLPVETVKPPSKMQEPLNKKMLLSTLDNFLCSPTPPSQKSSVESPKKEPLPPPKAKLSPPPPVMPFPKQQAKAHAAPTNPKPVKEHKELCEIKDFTLEQDLDLFCVIDPAEPLAEIRAKCLELSMACDAASHGVVISVVFDGRASSFRTKGLDADCNRLSAVGIAVLPDSAEKPFLLRMTRADNANSSPMTSALSDLFSSLKKKICYNSKLLYLPISSQFPKLCESLEFSSVFDLKLASWLLNPDIENENLSFENIVRPVTSVHSESSSFFSVLSGDMKKCLEASKIIGEKIKASTLWGSLSFETNGDRVQLHRVQVMQGEARAEARIADEEGVRDPRAQDQPRKPQAGERRDIRQPEARGGGGGPEEDDFGEGPPGAGREARVPQDCHRAQTLPEAPFDVHRVPGRKEVPRPHPAVPGQHPVCLHHPLALGANKHWHGKNLQNLPKGSITFSPIDLDEKEEIVVNVRDSFVSRPGYVFVISDYSQIELRILAHYTNDPKLISLFSEGIDFHTIVASRIYSKRAEDIHPEERSKAKKVIFGLLYGMGLTSLSENLGVSIQEAKSLRNSVLSNFPKMKDFISATLADAKKVGYVKTLLGRQRLVSDINSAIPEKRARAERQAVNTVIQGSAADVMKSAMVKLASRLSGVGGFILVQIHDEVVVEVPEGAQDAAVEIIRGSMTHPLPEGVLSVQLDVSVSVGKSWGSAKPLSEHVPENDSFDLGSFDI